MTCGFTGTGDIVDTDPLLGPLQDNGGPTFTHALLPGSPAIDAVPVAECTDPDGNPLTMDQRGSHRPSGVGCDKGAFELVILDIKPGTHPNSINCNNERGVIAVAILTYVDFDATTVDHTTVTFEGASETHENKRTGAPRRHEKDVDGDGDTDLVFHFRRGDTVLTCDSTEGTLAGETFDGQAIEFTDVILMISNQ